MTRPNVPRLLPLLTALGVFSILAARGAALQEGATTRVSVMTDCLAAQIGVGHTRTPVFSRDGRFVAYSSFNSSLGEGASTVAWFANLDGAGSYGPIQLITTDIDTPTAVELAFVGPDGTLDVITSSSLDDRIAWYSNDLIVSGGFAGPLDISLSLVQPTTVAAGDLDGDGDVDVLASAKEVFGSVWYANDGTGGFGQAIDVWPYAASEESLFPADVDGDGDLDVLFTIDFSPYTIAWRENTTGTGHFSSERLITAAADDPRAVWAGDIDGDGDQDVVAASAGVPAGPRIAWYRNVDGLGTFESGQIVSTANEPISVHGGDLDGDGDVDILAGFAFDSQMAWFENLDGGGTFGPANVFGGNSPTPVSVQLVDMDEDGDLDALRCSFGLDEVAWFRNSDGAGTFGAKKIVGAGLFNPEQAHAADVDGDGDQDVLVAHGDRTAWFENVDGLGTFGAEIIISDPVPECRAVHAVDIDGDGDLDAIAASRTDDYIEWSENLDGLGSFGPPQSIAAFADHPLSLHGADMDGDRDGDVLAYLHANNRQVYYENVDGRGGVFEEHEMFSSTSSKNGRIIATDVDGDGDQDALVAGGGLGDFSWYENPDGQAHFGKQHVIATQVEDPRCVHGADIDGDGDVDVVSASEGDDTVAWYRNLDGVGSFGPQQVIDTTTTNPLWVTTADVDGDGDLDVLAAAATADTVCWFSNLDGDGSFGPKIVVTDTADDARQAVAGDIDGDGDTDVVAVSGMDDVTAWHENLDGAGNSWARHVIFDGPAVGARGVRLGDLDADGDLDVVIASAAPGPEGEEIFLHDRFLLTTQWVSKTLDGMPSDALNPAISADGQVVAFQSVSSGLVPGPDFNAMDVYVHDVQQDLTTRVSVSSAGFQGNNTSVEPTLSGDGRYVAFRSYADNLVPGDPTCCSGTDVFLHDRLTGVTIMANRPPGGEWPTDGATDAALSTDGQYVAFSSGATNLIPGDTNGALDVFALHIPTGVIERVSLGTGGTEISGADSNQASLSADGRYVAFQTNASLDVLDTNIYPDIYVHDRQTLITHYASVTWDGQAADRNCEQPSLSDDGCYVSFISRATNVVPGLSTDLERAYRRDLQTGETLLMSVASDGTPAEADVPSANISGDGQLVAFETIASGLVPSDVDTVSDAFVHGVDPWFPLGCETPGSSEGSVMSGSGPLVPGSSGALILSSAAPSAPAMLFVAAVSQPAPFKGGVLVAFPPLLQVPLQTAPSGGIVLPFVWPAGLPANTELFMHLAVADAAAVQGVSLSSALRCVTP